MYLVNNKHDVGIRENFTYIVAIANYTSYFFPLEFFFPKFKCTLQDHKLNEH